MKEISKIFVLSLLGYTMLSIISCKIASIVNFESENFEQFKNNSIRIEEYPDTFYYTRVTTAVWVQLIFRKFSKEHDFSEIMLQNITIIDDGGIVLYKAENVLLSSNGVLHSENSCNYEIYTHKIETTDFNPIVLQNSKIKYINLIFEINGVKYSEQLKRDEKKYLLTRT